MESLEKELEYMTTERNMYSSQLEELQNKHKELKSGYDILLGMYQRAVKNLDIERDKVKQLQSKNNINGCFEKMDTKVFESQMYNLKEEIKKLENKNKSLLEDFENPERVWDRNLKDLEQQVKKRFAVENYEKEIKMLKKALELACIDKPRPIKLYDKYMCNLNDYIEFYKNQAEEQIKEITKCKTYNVVKIK